MTITTDRERQRFNHLVLGRARPKPTRTRKTRRGAAAVEPWWKRNGSTLLSGKRKTVELGGCMIGSKAGRSSLQFADGDDATATLALRAHRWARPYVRVTYSPDKTAIGTALAGKHGEQLRTLGFSKPAGEETFVLERVKQEGTVTA